MKNGPAKILVVDDEPKLRDIVSRALTKLGHQCLTATNGEEAVETMSKKSVDLVITDLKMPKMGGLGLIKWLRKVRPDTPVIIMTGYADVESARKALRLCVSDYLVKPFEGLGEVQTAVQRALETRSARSDSECLVRELEKRVQQSGRREEILTRRLERATVEMRALAKRLEQFETITLDQVGQITELIENLEHGILVTDPNGTVVSINRELRTQLQATNYHGTGTSVDRLPGDAVLRETILESTDRLNMGIEDPVFAQTTDGSGVACSYEVRSIPIGGQGHNAVGIVTTVRQAHWKPTGGPAEEGSRPTLASLVPERES
jgi:CheY-like chemotaxis protein